MTETHPDFTLYAGDRWQFDAALHDASGNALNLSGAEIVWRLHKSGNVIATRTVGDGITVTNALAGLCSIVNTKEQTEAFANGTYSDDIRVTIGDMVCTQAVGLITVTRAGATLGSAGSATDPCATLARLQQARIALVTGARETRVRIENFEVEYSAATMTDLDRAIANYDSLCRKQTGKAPRRHAIGSTMRPTS